MVLSKIKRTPGVIRYKLEENLFPMQQQWKQHNFTAETVVWVQRVLANKKQKRCFLRYKAQRTQFWCQLTKTYFRYYEAWGSVFSGEKLNRCFFWHKVRSFQFRCQQTKTCFPYEKGSKAKFNSEKKEKLALKNIMLKTAYHSKKQTKTLFWVKSSKIKVTRCKLADNPFPVQ